MRRARAVVGTWLSGKDEDVVIRQGEVSTSAVTMAARPWRAQYERGVPPTIDYPAQTLPEVFAEAAARYTRRAQTGALAAALDAAIAARRAPGGPADRTSRSKRDDRMDRAGR